MVVEVAINPICDQSRDGGRVSVSRGKPLGEEGSAARGRQSRVGGVTRSFRRGDALPSGESGNRAHFPSRVWLSASLAARCAV